MRSPVLAALVVAAVASTAFSQSAVSQQTSTTAPTGTEIAPRGQREVKEITYGDWQKLCFKPGGAKMICRTSITGTFPTGQMAVRVDIIEREGDATARLQVFCPVGMYLPKPATLTIDQGKPHRCALYLVPHQRLHRRRRGRSEDGPGNEFRANAAAGIR